MTTPATYRRVCVFLNLPETLRSEKKHLILAEIRISMFNLEKKKKGGKRLYCNANAVTQPMGKLIAN